MSDVSYAWFEPKSRGYGAGRPIVWQGRVVLGVYVVAVTAAALLLHRSPVGFVVAIIVATASFVAVAKATTRGGWKWRDETADPSAPSVVERSASKES